MTQFQLFIQYADGSGFWQSYRSTRTPLQLFSAATKRDDCIAARIVEYGPNGQPVATLNEFGDFSKFGFSN